MQAAPSLCIPAYINKTVFLVHALVLRGPGTPAPTTALWCASTQSRAHAAAAGLTSGSNAGICPTSWYVHCDALLSFSPSLHTAPQRATACLRPWPNPAVLVSVLGPRRLCAGTLRAHCGSWHPCDTLLGGCCPDPEGSSSTPRFRQQQTAAPAVLSLRLQRRFTAAPPVEPVCHATAGVAPPVRQSARANSLH